MVAAFIQRVCKVLIVVALAAAAPARADAGHQAQPFRVRALKPCGRALLADAARQSLIVRALIDGLENSDLLVFIRCVPQRSALFGGRLALGGATDTVRVVVIELWGPLGWSEQVAMLAHELQHASELAAAPWVRDPRTMEAHFRNLGVEVARRPLVFDPPAAVEIGERVRREVFARGPRRRPDASRGPDE